MKVPVENERKLRLADFAKRWRFAQCASDIPNGAIHVSQHDWDYIPVHPTADETELLRTVGVKPNDCLEVDCYWSTKQDVYFLQVKSTRRSNRLPGLYALWNRTFRPSMRYLLAIVPEAPITRPILERAMEQFASLNLQSTLFSKAKLSSDEYTPICALCSFAEIDKIIDREVTRRLKMGKRHTAHAV